MEHKEGPLEMLLKSAGFYTGYGVNHDDQQFRGILELTPIIGNNGVYIKYRSVGLRGDELEKDTSLFSRDTRLYHEEHTLIAKNNVNKLTLWTISILTPTVSLFNLRRYRRIPNQKAFIVFGFGNREDNTIFREEISVEIWDSGSIAYNYFWGEPGGLFLSRSTVIMRKI